MRAYMIYLLGLIHSKEKSTKEAGYIDIRLWHCRNINQVMASSISQNIDAKDALVVMDNTCWGLLDGNKASKIQNCFAHLPTCSTEDETVKHALVDCPLIKQFWQCTFDNISVHTNPALTGSAILQLQLNQHIARHQRLRVYAPALAYGLLVVHRTHI
jgi:hypothetical protein